MAEPVVISRLHAPVGEADLAALSALLVETVDGGHPVSFLAPMSIDDARAWWEKTLRNAVAHGARGPIVLVAREEEAIVGTVQMQPAWAPNQPHRAEVVKLMVATRARGRGLGARLMAAIEDEALRAGYTLLTLDAKEGGGAERLYRRTGWTAVGTIPRFAIDPDGRGRHGTVIFFKELSATRGS